MLKVPSSPQRGHRLPEKVLNLAMKTPGVGHSQVPNHTCFITMATPDHTPCTHPCKHTSSRSHIHYCLTGTFSSPLRYPAQKFWPYEAQFPPHMVPVRPTGICMDSNRSKLYRDSLCPTSNRSQRHAPCLCPLAQALLVPRVGRWVGVTEK